MAEIAREEQGHAALAWRVMRWGIAKYKTASIAERELGAEVARRVEGHWREVEQATPVGAFA
jgi:hypothetical protein